VGPQTREILEDEVYVEILADTERALWENFKWVCAIFLRKKKSPDFSDGMQKLLGAWGATRLCFQRSIQLAPGWSTPSPV
jgi:hypothetical protein